MMKILILISLIENALMIFALNCTRERKIKSNVIVTKVEAPSVVLEEFTNEIKTAERCFELCCILPGACNVAIFAVINDTFICRNIKCSPMTSCSATYAENASLAYFGNDSETEMLDLNEKDVPKDENNSNEDNRSHLVSTTTLGLSVKGENNSSLGNTSLPNKNVSINSKSLATNSSNELQGDDRVTPHNINNSKNITVSNSTALLQINLSENEDNENDKTIELGELETSENIPSSSGSNKLPIINSKSKGSDAGFLFEDENDYDESEETGTVSLELELDAISKEKNNPFEMQDDALLDDFGENLFKKRERLSLVIWGLFIFSVCCLFLLFVIKYVRRSSAGYRYRKLVTESTTDDFQRQHYQDDEKKLSEFRQYSI